MSKGSVKGYEHHASQVDSFEKALSIFATTSDNRLPQEGKDAQRGLLAAAYAHFEKNRREMQLPSRIGPSTLHTISERPHAGTTVPSEPRTAHMPNLEGDPGGAPSKLKSINTSQHKILAGMGADHSDPIYGEDYANGYPHGHAYTAQGQSWPGRSQWGKDLHSPRGSQNYVYFKDSKLNMAEQLHQQTAKAYYQSQIEEGGFGPG